MAETAALEIQMTPRQLVTHRFLKVGEPAQLARIERAPSENILFKLVMRKKIHTALMGLWIGFLSMALFAQTACPNPGMCFLSKKAKDEWALENNCTFNTPKITRDCSEKLRSDQGFLRAHEGELITDGYVPKYKKDIKNKAGKVIHKKGDVIGASGVTISSGVDLGQQSNSGTKKIINNYINDFGNVNKVDVDALIKKLDPYFGPTKRKENAVKALADAHTPLVISPEEALLLDRSFGYDTQIKAANQFDKKNTQNMKFKTLPEEAQTVIVDFAYQYGISDSLDPMRKQFWDYVYLGQWQDLANWLKSKPDPYTSRRADEGNRLQQGIDGDKLPTSGNPCMKSS